MRLPWWSSGEDSVLSVQGMWVQSLVRELRSHMLHSLAKQTKKILPLASEVFFTEVLETSSRACKGTCVAVLSTLCLKRTLQG